MDVFESYQLGKMTLKNRVVMAPMTRCRAINNIPNELMAEYYKQRAGAGLIITEGTSPSPNGLGYPRIPGAFNDEQIAGWKKIADAVHEVDGKIFVQLMHCGRISGSANLPQGAFTVGPSAVQAAGEIFSDTGMIAHDIPKEMTLKDIEIAKSEYANAAYRLVNEAGVDGVEIHAANGYLPNQFLNPKSNKRTDNYGGDFENRSRFVLETVKKVVEKIGSDKVGIRLSPYGAFNDMEAHHDEVKHMFTYITKTLSKLKLSYMHIVDQGPAFDADLMANILKIIKETFNGSVITGGDVNNSNKAEAVINRGYDLVYVGRPYISNPNFVEQIKLNEDLVTPNMDLFYSAEAEGYTTY
ncbi:alkene reductase [Flavivirga aquimarina]|uniref:Alkene reductase n=1 Tax=Flavivirga aquimarina TaxID=2027862 RepID=A0ABT8WE94_9FLAO|nr:alkene reductase [Flavivirga aquimarina]MDO5971433.1 alkene reductase [Flavivirga aquimarina]